MTHEEILQHLDAFIISCDLSRVEPQMLSALRYARASVEGGERLKYGFATSFGTVYGTEETTKLTAKWFEELMELRRYFEKEQELKDARAEIERVKRLCREHLIDPDAPRKDL
jgi:hypothetical protein